jgi:hypothetical protein
MDDDEFLGEVGEDNKLKFILQEEYECIFKT